LDSKTKIILLVRTIYITSFAIALYSLLNHYTKGAYSLFDSIPPWTVSWEKVTHGTFSYQNHYASFLTLTIPLGLGLLYENYIRIKNKQSNLKFFFNNLFYFISLPILFLALLKTGSRGAVFIFVFTSLLILIHLAIKYRFFNKYSKKILVYLLITIISVFIIIVLSETIIVQRFLDKGFSSNGRSLMYETGLKILLDYPLFGTGPGTYSSIQFYYKTPDLGNTLMSQRAHNDYVEFLCNYGLIGFSIFSIGMFSLLKSAYKAVVCSNSRLPGINAACLVGILCILLHSIIDFNFNLPVNTWYFFILISIIIASKYNINKRSY
jgi:O-antigen ligase